MKNQIKDAQYEIKQETDITFTEEVFFNHDDIFDIDSQNWDSFEDYRENKFKNELDEKSIDILNKKYSLCNEKEKKDILLSLYESKKKKCFMQEDEYFFQTLVTEMASVTEKNIPEHIKNELNLLSFEDIIFVNEESKNKYKIFIDTRTINYMFSNNKKTLFDLLILISNERQNYFKVLNQKSNKTEAIFDIILNKNMDFCDEEIVENMFKKLFNIFVFENKTMYVYLEEDYYSYYSFNTKRLVSEYMVNRNNFLLDLEKIKTQEYESYLRDKIDSSPKTTSVRRKI